MQTAPAPAPARADLATHEVTNQPDGFADRNLYLLDAPLREAARREAGDWLDDVLSPFGACVGAGEVLDRGEAANRNPPELIGFDRYGRRLDEVRFHPAYHELMALAMERRVHDLSWTGPGRGAHCAHAAMLALFTQAEAGVMCPMTMTYAAVPVLRADPEVGRAWEAKIVGGAYDAPLVPIAAKRGVTMGMAMTEKQGGSDVRANTTRATRFAGAGPRAFVLSGHKWFCSAPMSDGFLSLAYTEKGLSCFLVPRVTPDGARNAIHLMRLKEKLGNRSNASAEIEYHDAYAELIGEEGRGVNTIIEMVHHTRLGTISGVLGIMRGALVQAIHHVSGRRAFQKTLIDQPLMRRVTADLALEYEAAAALVMRVAARFDAPTPEGRAFARLAVALAKYLLTKRCANFVYECMECLGGAGYVEESPLPRLYREAPLNAIWEGSGNVIALDVLRTLAKAPEALDAFLAEVGAAGARRARLGAAMAELKGLLAGGAIHERDARHVAERMALILQAALLVEGAPAPVGDAFVASRLGETGGLTFAAHRAEMDEALLLGRAMAG
ncbi:DNA alkylation response protein [Pikeienuella piscinae]|uniref:DNA alkylation response protein n=1 Tax=Pikeienuella piscinae TaxID=2748098 RepID=A0A7L5BU53_9RHOB|nr:acyl-CoA dehydrogenase family protein [Pikeienuella piscinae]QIE55750.1 DNA alkylation response protein [Pikeienuella piscinae]